ncbi:hypothetical protein AU468_05995 [Alkalispirochaeta sphaeroplastigenens]|uniref:Uncharacterized protein n=1 Tax=Alkalispirochaeta sphaeroplastigenens TaxID=1187066 RepID=A0A2S4JUA8_9SPIO|nr:hypothetical protein AU468_05995 [Alkalispirochaeta sphaeroplastigenens]
MHHQERCQESRNDQYQQVRTERNKQERVLQKAVGHCQMVIHQICLFRLEVSLLALFEQHGSTVGEAQGISGKPEKGCAARQSKGGYQGFA